LKADKKRWNNRYINGQTGWDIGYPSTPLKEYIDTLDDKKLKILIPGCGNAYEAEYLLEQGFADVTVIDIAAFALKGFSERVPSFSKKKLINGNFFEHEGSYDLILEQTFFCALNPELRNDYGKKIHQLLKQNGKLVGVLFNFPLTEKGPPFGGKAEEYCGYFEKKFEIISMTPCQNSIKPRMGKELWVEMKKA